MTDADSLNRLSFFAHFVEKLGRVTTSPKIHRFALRETARFFGACEGCIALCDRPGRLPRIETETKQKAQWDLDLFADFIRNRRPAIPRTLLLAPLRIKNRTLGLIALRRDDDFLGIEAKFLCRLAARVSEELTAREEKRLLTVRARISRDIMRGLRPKDVFYKLLDGLEELLGYDHSAAILILDSEKDVFVVQAEKITWHKGKSDLIGLELPANPEVNSFLFSTSSPMTFSRTDGGEWETTASPHCATVLRLLDYNRGRPLPSENALIFAPLRSRGELLGLLKISSCLSQAFAGDDLQTVQQFLPQAQAAIRASQWSATLHERTIQSEKRLGILELARGVSHDINNALGAVLPLTQSIISDLKQGDCSPDELLQDMFYIEENVKLCVRIFGSMLDYAKTADSGQSTPVSIRKCIRAAVKLLERGLNTKGISLEIDIQDDLPPILANPNRLQQVFFNIISNAGDAMPNGGTLRIRAHRNKKAVQISFQDTGLGIKKEDLKRVMEPFFTTKKEGTGLGLSICRSIVWESNGRMKIESRPGKGTTVSIDFPITGGENEASGDPADKSTQNPRR
jgi:two-component system NtrC family sensor kinase